jgi:hypothetical protein
VASLVGEKIVVFGVVFNFMRLLGLAATTKSRSPLSDFGARLSVSG